MKVRRQRDRRSVEMWKGRERGGEVVGVKGKGIEIAERNR